MTRRPALALAVAVAGALALAGCTSTVSLTPAPHATAVGCAGVVVRLPPEITDQQQRTTDAQGTAAWGSPASVVLTCGLDPVSVSDDPCFDYDGVNWLQRDAVVGGTKRIVLTTYGRTPAVQVLIDPKRSASSDVVAAVSEAVRSATRGTPLRCLAAGDVTPTPTPTP